MKPPVTPNPSVRPGDDALTTKVLRSGSRLLLPTFASNSKHKAARNPNSSKGGATAGSKSADARPLSPTVSSHPGGFSTEVMTSEAASLQPVSSLPDLSSTRVFLDNNPASSAVAVSNSATSGMPFSAPVSVIPPPTVSVEPVPIPHAPPVDSIVVFNSPTASQTTVPPVIPELPKGQKKTHVPDKSYASAAAGSSRPPDVFASGFTAIRPVKQGNIVSIVIPDNIYEEQLNAFRFSIIGRMVNQKGDKLLSPAIIKEELDRILSPAGDWTLISMGRGFFTLKFGCEADLRLAARRPLIKLSTGVMYMREWTPDFDPFSEQSSMAHVWIKAYNLPAFYWHPQVLTGLLSAAGKVIKFDGNTMSGMVGQFVRALVEVDLAQPLLDSVKVGCGESSFLVEFVYENLPYFCTSCKMVGHSVDRCHKNKNKEGNIGSVDKSHVKQAEAVDARANRGPGAEEWRVKEDKRRPRSPRKKVGAEVCNTSNRFDALADHMEQPPNAVDILDKVTVAVSEGSPSVQGRSQQDFSAVDQRLVNLERRMQADKVISQVVSSMKTVSSSQNGLVIVNEKLAQASSLGANPTAFVVQEGGSPNLEVMNTVVRRDWELDGNVDSEDEVDSDGFPSENLGPSQ